MWLSNGCGCYTIVIIYCYVYCRFADTYFKSPACRFYGGNVGTVFEKIKLPSYADQPFKAAAEQFNGDGSYGNGSGMRVFPVALFCHKNYKEVEEVCFII